MIEQNMWKWIVEKLENEIIELSRVKSEDQLTDILIKVVSSQNFSKTIDKLDMRNIYAPT